MDSGWKLATGDGVIQVVDYGLWIDGEFLSEKDELEGTKND